MSRVDQCASRKRARAIDGSAMSFHLRSVGMKSQPLWLGTATLYQVDPVPRHGHTPLSESISMDGSSCAEELPLHHDFFVSITASGRPT